jgi:thiol-disulfide isomerase/thioredoxin
MNNAGTAAYTDTVWAQLYTANMKSIFLSLFFSVILIIVPVNCTTDKSFPISVEILTIDSLKINSSTIFNDCKFVLMEFWSNYCRPCLMMFDAVKDNFDTWNHKTDFKIIAIAIQEPDAKIVELIKQRNWPFEFYFDPDYNLFRQLSKYHNKNEIIFSVPTIFVFDNEWRMIDKLRGAKIKLKEGYKVPKEEEAKADMFEIDLDYYYKLYEDIRRKE